MKNQFLKFCGVLLLSFLLTPVYAQDKSDAEMQEMERQLDEAREELREATRKITELSREMSKGEVRTFVQTFGKSSNRAVLGVKIDAPESGQDGVAIVGVTPGSPADSAGLKAGDVITGLNGASIDSQRGDSAVDSLLSELKKLAPGDVANVDIDRDGKALNIDVVTGHFHDFMPSMDFDFSFDGDFDEEQFADAMKNLEDGRLALKDRQKVIIDLQGMEELENLPHRLEESLAHLEHMPAIAMIGGPLGPAIPLKLAPVNTDLGTYFGVDHGVLLTEAPDDDALGFRAGDVILSVDGEDVKEKRDVYRKILGSKTGDVLSFNIVRQKESLTLDVTVPERSFGKDWKCDSSPDGHKKRCVKKDGGAFQYSFSDDED